MDEDKYILDYSSDQVYSVNNEYSASDLIEIFDDPELETQNALLSGFSSDKNSNVLAYSKYFTVDDNRFVWHPCKVQRYDNTSKKFHVVFNVKYYLEILKSTVEEIDHENQKKHDAHPDFVTENSDTIFKDTTSNSRYYSYKTRFKELNRLQIRFKDESSKVFESRLQASWKQKHSQQCANHYWHFVSKQETSLVSQMNTYQFQSILDKLNSIQNLIVRMQGTTTQLLVEVKQRYTLAMKQSMIEYCRMANSESNRLSSMKLPCYCPMPVSDSGIISDFQSCDTLTNIIEGLNGSTFIKHPCLSKVLLEINKDFATIFSENCLIKILNDGSAMQPMQFFQQQKNHFVAMTDTLIVDWREKAISLIRDLELGEVGDVFTSSLLQVYLLYNLLNA